MFFLYNGHEMTYNVEHDGFPITVEKVLNRVSFISDVQVENLKCEIAGVELRRDAVIDRSLLKVCNVTSISTRVHYYISCPSGPEWKLSVDKHIKASEIYTLFLFREDIPFMRFIYKGSELSPEDEEMVLLPFSKIYGRFTDGNNERTWDSQVLFYGLNATIKSLH